MNLNTGSPVEPRENGYDAARTAVTAISSYVETTIIFHMLIVRTTESARLPVSFAFLCPLLLTSRFLFYRAPCT